MKVMIVEPGSVNGHRAGDFGAAAEAIIAAADEGVEPGGGPPKVQGPR
jgi:hypothetical protein